MKYSALLLILLSGLAPYSALAQAPAEFMREAGPYTDDFVIKNYYNVPDTQVNMRQTITTNPGKQEVKITIGGYVTLHGKAARELYESLCRDFKNVKMCRDREEELRVGNVLCMYVPDPKAEPWCQISFNTYQGM